MRCRVAIPTFNRAHLVARAVRSALDQSHTDLEIVVIDDGSTDDTQVALSPFMANPRFCYVRLRHNAGTAAAKNVAIVLGTFDAISFHDSDDIAERDKILRQAATLQIQGLNADPILNWSMSGRPPGAALEIGVALTQHWLLAADGGRRHIRRALSLVDDFFPQLQMNAGPLGDWILINPGLFRRSALARVGGFEQCVEEDRELRNRLIMHGEIIWLIEEPLLTKVECADGLTVDNSTGYRSPQRTRDRNMVWARAAAWRAGAPPPVAPIDLQDVEIVRISNPRFNILAEDLPMIGAPRMPA
jgi:glycosyltransferase involved in cell wall biosynthesis